MYRGYLRERTCVSEAVGACLKKIKVLRNPVGVRSLNQGTKQKRAVCSS